MQKPTDQTPDLAHRASYKETQEASPHTARWFFVFLGITVVAVGLAFAYRVLSETTTILSGQYNNASVASQIKGLVTSGEKPLRGESDGRTNILLIGHGGAGHSGRYLADTLILASYNYDTDKLAMVSIPRDLYVEIEGHRWGKINNALAFGIEDKVGEKLVVDTVEKITGQTVHYFVRADFDGFKGIVDALDGITVNVETTFTDYAYPDNNYGYQVVSFKKGEQTMDGETALEFSRSRHGNNGEGSDFARSERQQKVMFGIKEKVLSTGTLLNPTRIFALLNSLGETVNTNFEIWEALSLYDKIKGVSESQIANKVIDNSPGGLLYSYVGEIDGAYLLSPNAGMDDFSEIHTFVENIFAQTTIEKEQASVLIQNGTKRNKLATQVAEDLTAQGMTVVGTENAQRQDFEKTVIYDLTFGKKPETLQTLVAKFQANVSTSIPSWLLNDPSRELTVDGQEVVTTQTTQTDGIDFILILGQNTPTPLTLR